MPHSLKIVIVEPNRKAAETLAKSLTAWGHTPHIAANETEALAAAQTYRPDVFLLNSLGSGVFKIAAKLCDEAGIRGEQFLMQPAEMSTLERLLSTWPSS